MRAAGVNGMAGSCYVLPDLSVHELRGIDFLSVNEERGKNLRPWCSQFVVDRDGQTEFQLLLATPPSLVSEGQKGKVKISFAHG